MVKINKETKRGIGILILFILTVSAWMPILNPSSLEWSLLIITPLFYLTLLTAQKKLPTFNDVAGVVTWICIFSIIFKLLGIFFGALGVIIFFIAIVLRIVIKGVLSPAFKEGLDEIQPFFDEALPWRKRKIMSKKLNQRRKN